MTLKTKILLLIFMLICLASCQGYEPEYTSDTSLQQYFMEFEKEALLRGIEFRKYVPMRYAEITHLGFRGYAYDHEILIDSVMYPYKDYYAWHMEILMFHEFGHAYLHIGHTHDTLDYMSTPAPNFLNKSDYYANRKQMLDKLFTASNYHF